MYLNTKYLIAFHMSSIFKQIKLLAIQKRYLYRVQHNSNRQIFYVKLESNERAVLLYKKNDDVLDMQSVNVPQNYRRRGIARLLGETAITYAVSNNYRIILTCPFMQRLYTSIKTPELEKLIIGPSNILLQSGPAKTNN